MRTGALSASKACCETSAAMSVARLQRGLASSTTTRRPVSSTLSRMASRSSGEVVRGSITVQPTPSPSSPSAAWLASPTMRPMATTVTSSPSRVRLASPKGMV